KLGGLLKMPKESVDQLFAEIRARLREELDYENEASNIRMFQNFHRADPHILIPDVIPSLSRRRVLTLSYVPGDHIDAVCAPHYSQERINAIGQRIFKTMADQLFLFQCIHGDPHAGNFAYRPDGSVILYDFGCVKKLKPTVVQAYRNTLVAALMEDYAALDRYLIDLGARVEDKPAVDEAYYAMWRDILIRPFASAATYDFGQSELHKEVAAQTPTIFKYLDHFKPPVESIFIDRMIAGHYWMMKRLGVQAAFRPALENYLGLGSGA
ncbi:MAG: AarF/UbiB family protein, partial [Gammaproteobacteria bacterium]|nr:AarF/UbiB family protein [Gammaproteobacteria bacterium]